MSAELPELERLLSEAAERHYGEPARRAWWSRGQRRISGAARRPGLPRSLTALPVFVVLAVLCASLAVVLRSTPVSDERAVTPVAPRTGDRLGQAFSVFARPERSPSPFETDLLKGGFLDRSLDTHKPTVTRLLYSHGHTGVIAVVGTAPSSSREAVCLFDVHEGNYGGGCIGVTALLARRDPYVATGTQQGIGDIVWALVRDDVTSVEVRIAGAPTRDVPIANNLAYVESHQTICSLRWTYRDGTSGISRVTDPFGSHRDCR